MRFYASSTNIIQRALLWKHMIKYSWYLEYVRIYNILCGLSSKPTILSKLQKVRMMVGSSKLNTWQNPIDIMNLQALIL